MKIVGISGFEGAMAFQRSRWPHLDEREYRISQGHDAAAALVVDGTIVAAVAEERIDRHKHSASFPKGAIKYCLSEAGLRVDQIDALVHSFDYAPYQSLLSLDAVSRERYRAVYSREALGALVRRDLPGFPMARVDFVAHHAAHAASAYYTSGWSECLVMVLDGLGEVHSGTIFRGRGGRLEPIAQIGAQDSLGILYSLVTLHLGFDFNSDEYKIMGLAPYGAPERFRSIFQEAVQTLPDGGVRIGPLRLNGVPSGQERHLRTRAWLTEALGPPRAPHEAITDRHRDIAAALQECLDRTLLALCRHYAEATGMRRLALAGGVALNCTANGRLLRSGMFDEIYVQPAAGDDGSALGAALHRAALAGEVCNERLATPFLGPEHTRSAIDAALAARAQDVRITTFSTLPEACATAARLIGEGHVIAWYRGRMEFGPRALGHRSILADPGVPEMRDRINAMVKMREAFRPFAPAVTIEQVGRWFDVPAETALPFMTMTVPVRPEFRSDLPAITHVDGSARVQTVSLADNWEFHQLLRAIGKVTGREMVLNTSFNVKGQPIVNTPVEALDTFLGTGIEHLFLENTLVSRRAD